ncbi:hypothetical protein N658DRAFT_197775 [Parathielavia hyrcaniae]|uniref:Uncharacterized protein n=1 Tax=Parathielavia hyrcaniae TaxID=113614 RepID=A0AAN6Q8Q8_9PEZI|nr:hypothetical protein N658DRAFT_197775 [Parathielavia hyrcaniae]
MHGQDSKRPLCGTKPLRTATRPEILCAVSGCKHVPPVHVPCEISRLRLSVLVYTLELSFYMPMYCSRPVLSIMAVVLLNLVWPPKPFLFFFHRPTHAE